MANQGGSNPYAAGADLAVFAVAVAAVEGAAPNGLAGFGIGLAMSVMLVLMPRRRRVDAMWTRHRARSLAAMAVSLYFLYAGVSGAVDTESGGWGFVFGLAWPWLTYWVLRRFWIVKKDEL